jgi:hypothetical protein
VNDHGIFRGKRRLDRCPGTATKVTQVGLVERGRYPIDKQYQCHECGRWLATNAQDRIPFHLTHPPGA